MEEFDQTETQAFARRDALISAMLQDRNALRLISAPHGFGKTTLAKEYAQRMFNGERVVWVDGASPAFLHMLDEGAASLGKAGRKLGKLVIIDDLAFLSEDRQEALSKRLDALLLQNVEVIVTTVPANDFLRSTQPDRILLRAGDLLVSKTECSQQQPGKQREQKARALRAWKAATSELFGRVPAQFWGAGNMEGRCFEDLFGEGMPLQLLKSLFAMLLLGEGTFADLERMGLAMKSDDERMLNDDYPLFGIDPVQRSFSIARFDLQILRAAVYSARMADVLLAGSFSIPERVVSLLMRRGAAKRACAVMQCFCSDERCGLWMREQGWQLLDNGELELVDSLFERVPLEMMRADPLLMAMSAWRAGLHGSRREATYFSQLTLRKDTQGSQVDEERIAHIAAYLALLAFGEGGASIYAKPVLASNAQVDSPIAFLAAVLDLMEPVEIERALCVDDTERLKRLEKQRKNPSKEREDAISHLFEEGSLHFAGSLWYRVALHLLRFVDSTTLHSLLQDLGCEVVVTARRDGVSSLVDALLIRDLWETGFFGLASRTGGDRQDATLLGQTANTLRRLEVVYGEESIVLPWEFMPKRHVEKANAQEKPKAAEPETVFVRMFGGFQVTVGDRVVKDSEWRRKPRMLFMLLVLHQGRDVSRDEIFAQLWPNASRLRAMDNFYSMWGKIVSILGSDAYVERSGEFCRIDSRYVVSDVAEFEQLSRQLLVERGNAAGLLDFYARVESIYRGGLLSNDMLTPYMVSQDERFRAMYVDAMVAATHRSLDMGDARLALWFARKAMEADKGREDVYAALLRAQIAAGQRCSAIRTYFACRDYLRDELGLDPSREVQELYDQLITVDPSLLKLDPTTFGS